ncbi:hypothetical protein BpHYR1_024176 [Brachionus plicatilis]|uniref:Uncharacterized protein n=1 Tax=Brachionus plicatilis TaxID=10195 RepID=A0A3M7PWE7_BRAPC|nr:hypothetical protein BpHYR1_024176 [Brachionus plicatilis]
MQGLYKDEVVLKVQKKYKEINFWFRLDNLKSDIRSFIFDNNSKPHSLKSLEGRYWKGSKDRRKTSECRILRIKEFRIKASRLNSIVNAALNLKNFTLNEIQDSKHNFDACGVKYQQFLDKVNIREEKKNNIQ